MRTLSFRQSACISTIAISMGVVLALSGAKRAFADESLDKILATAMDNHPDIVAAKAKVALAEAELNATRLQVARQVITLWGEKNSRAVAVGKIQEEIDQTSDRIKRKILIDNLYDARIKLEQAEAEIKFLTAKKTDIAPQSKESRTPKPLQIPTGPIVDKIRSEFPTKTIEFEFVDQPLDQVINYIADNIKFPILIDNAELSNAGIDSNMPITMKMGRTPILAAIQALQDKYQSIGLQFVIRDYGILLTTAEQAKQQGYCPVLIDKELSPGPETYTPATSPSKQEKP